MPQRVEVIISSFLAEEFVAILQQHATLQYYTQIPQVHGVGKHGGRFGNTVWPETNTIFLFFCAEEQQVQELREVFYKLQDLHPTEGMKLFIT